MYFFIGFGSMGLTGLKGGSSLYQTLNAKNVNKRIEISCPPST